MLFSSSVVESQFDGVSKLEIEAIRTRERVNNSKRNEVKGSAVRREFNYFVHSIVANELRRAFSTQNMI